MYGYGLQEVIQLIIPSTYQELNTAILGAFDKREPILFYYWGPEVVPTRLNEQYGGFFRLEEPAYSDECWDHLAAASQAQDVTQACAYPDRQRPSSCAPNCAKPRLKPLRFSSNGDFLTSRSMRCSPAFQRPTMPTAMWPPGGLKTPMNGKVGSPRA